MNKVPHLTFKLTDLPAGHSDNTDLPLPEESHDRLSETIASLQSSMEALLRHVIVRMTEQSVRQSAIRDRDFARLEADHVEKVQSLEAEVAYLTEYVDLLESEAETESEPPVTESAELEPERASPQAPAPAAVPQAAARKSPNRPLKKTPPSSRKPARQSPAKPKKSLRQAASPS